MRDLALEAGLGLIVRHEAVAIDAAAYLNGHVRFSVYKHRLCLSLPSHTLPLVRAFLQVLFFYHLFFLGLQLPTMQVSLMISTLLAGLTILLSLHAVDSLSASRRSEPQLFTLPLKRISQPDNNTHPVIVRDNLPTVRNIPNEHCLRSVCKIALIAVLFDWQ